MQGMLFDEEFLPFFQMSPLPLSVPSFLQASLKSYSAVRRWGGCCPPPPPPARLPLMPVWHNALFANSFHLTYHCPALLKKGVLRWVDLVEGGGVYP